MEASQGKGGRREQKRPHVIAPPPPWRLDLEAGPGAVDMLRDVDGVAGLALWRALRDVHLWATTPPERRSGAFHCRMSAWVRERHELAAAAAPEIAAELETLARVASAPHLVDVAQLGAACAQVAAWAEARSSISTAAYFAEAAACLDPAGSAGRANDAGRICRRAGLPGRSAWWYERGYRLAVRLRSRRETLRALLGFGALLQALGSHGEARPFFLRAARRAARTGRRRQAAEAHHDLLLLCAELGCHTEAEEHARRALALYPLAHPRVPYLVHDFAFLLVRQRHHIQALALFEQLTQKMGRPKERALLWGSLAWAAAGAGSRERFQEAEAHALQLVEEGDQDYAPGALLHLAEGARALWEWKLAAAHARAAADLAAARLDTALQREAAELLELIEERRPAEPLEPVAGAVVEMLSRCMARSLKAGRAPARSAPEPTESGVSAA